MLLWSGATVLKYTYQIIYRRCLGGPYPFPLTARSSLQLPVSRALSTV